MPPLLRLVALLALAGTACTTADAASPAVPPPDPQPVAAVAIAARLTSTGGVPAVTGLDLDEAGRLLAEAGAMLQAVAVGPGATITAQYPAAGLPVPADGQVIVWLGRPPAPPPPPEPPDPPPAETTSEVATADTPPAEPSSEPAPERTNIRTVEAAAPGTVLTGQGSWYGDEFAGRTTACGGVFDPTELTLATRELRCGTRVLVTGPTGASVTATVTDWGPAEWTGRRFDLSKATFAAIHHLGAGVIEVTVEVLP
jgi:hypothetical protein